MDFFQMFVSKHRHSCCMQYAIRWGVTSWLEKSTCYQHLFGWFRGMSLDRDLCIVFESAKRLFSDHLILSTIPKLTYESITPCILQHGMRCFAWRSYRWMIQKFWDAKCHVFVFQILVFWTLASIKWQGIQSFVKIIHCNANHLFAFCGLGIWSLTGSDLRFSNSGHLGLAGKGVEKRLGSRTVPVASQSSHQTDVRWNQQNTADFGPDGPSLDWGMMFEFWNAKNHHRHRVALQVRGNQDLGLTSSGSKAFYAGTEKHQKARKWSGHQATGFLSFIQPMFSGGSMPSILDVKSLDWWRMNMWQWFLRSEKTPCISCKHYWNFQTCIKSRHQKTNQIFCNCTVWSVLMQQSGSSNTSSLFRRTFRIKLQVAVNLR